MCPNQALVMEVGLLAFCSSLLNPRTMRAMQAHILDEYSVPDISQKKYPDEEGLCRAMQASLRLLLAQKVRSPVAGQSWCFV